MQIELEPKLSLIVGDDKIVTAKDVISCNFLPTLHPTKKPKQLQSQRYHNDQARQLTNDTKVGQRICLLCLT